jgi:hypothetical protein
MLPEEKTRKKTLFAWFAFIAILLIIQGSLLWIDHHPLFFLGDSASYIETAISGCLPRDRSFVYGYFIRLVAVTTESLTSLVVIQVLLGCVTSIVMAHLLIRYFRVQPWIAFVAALLSTLEPLHLLYVHQVMTETLALAIFVFYVWVALHYLENPRIKWLVVIQCIATLMISVRYAFIPITWSCALAIPLLALPALAVRARLTGVKVAGRLAVHVVLSVLLLFIFTTAYKHFNGYLQNKPPAYSYDRGFSAMCYVLPILEPDDFTDKTLGEQTLNHLAFPVTDPRARGPHRWMKEGAVFRLQKLKPDLIKAEAIASQAAFHAVSHKPIAFLHLGWQTFTDYFDPTDLQSNMEGDLGNSRLEDGFYNLIKTRFHYQSDQSSALDLKTPTGRYFLRSGHWIQLLFFLPLGWLVLIIVTREADQRQKSLLMGFISLIFIGVALFLVERSTPRFLHGSAWIFFMMAAVGLHRFLPGGDGYLRKGFR